MKNYNTSGFTLLETVIAIAVFSVFFAAVAFLLHQLLEIVGTTRVRTIALSVGQERMEEIRNLPYATVGTIGGIPQGPIEQSETISINSLEFTILTSIQYIDDPYDGVSPTDTIASDYKRVRVQVTWGGLYPSRVPVTLVTNIVPKGKESNTSGGTLSIQVLNSQGLPVEQASVTVTNSVVAPPINVTILTDANGMVTLPASPPCVSCYNVSVTKATYSTDQTHTTAEVANPIQAPATVLEGTVTPLTFAIDKLGSISVRSYGTKEAGYPVITNVQFSLRGAKIIGYDTADVPVYKYLQTFTTGGGIVGIPNLEWDNYTIDLSNSSYTLAGSNPIIPFTLAPQTSFPVSLSVGAKFARSLLVIVKDQLDNLQPFANVRLYNSAISFDVTKTTAATAAADFGQVFFNDIPQETYALYVSLPPFQEASSSVEITSNQKATIVLSQ